MKNQPNDMVTFEWLLPLFNQQLSQVADGWQLGEKSADYEEIAKSYHQIGGALTMINLPALASLANKLSLLTAAGRFDSKADLKHNSEIGVEARFGTDTSRIAQMAHLQRAAMQDDPSLYQSVLRLVLTPTRFY